MLIDPNQRKLTSILKEYFDDNHHNQRTLIKEEKFPILPSICDWEVHDSPERFSKTYNLSDKTQVFNFIGEVLKYESQANHDGTIKIAGKKVTIEVYTHDLNRITELDQEYIREVDLIYKDVLDFGKY